LRILWFGDASNFTLFAKYAETLRGVPDAEVLVITNAAAIGSLAQRFTGISFLPWSRDTFLSILQSAALSLLTHDGTEADRAKSNNRMITSITWGVPAVVSRTPEYERTARECRIETSLFDDPGACVAAIERLRTRAARYAYLDAAQAEVWQRYSPTAVSGRFLAVVARHRDCDRPARKMPTYWQWLRSACTGGLSDALRSELRHVLRP
jgi:hypothetical protein